MSCLVPLDMIMIELYRGSKLLTNFWGGRAIHTNRQTDRLTYMSIYIARWLILSYLWSQGRSIWGLRTIFYLSLKHSSDAGFSLGNVLFVEIKARAITFFSCPHILLVAVAGYTNPFWLHAPRIGHWFLNCLLLLFWEGLSLVVLEFVMYPLALRTFLS